MTLQALIVGVPGEWQTRAVAGPLTAEEWHDYLRVEVAAAKVDVYRFLDGVTVAVVPSESNEGHETEAIFRRIISEAGTSVALGLLDVWIGVPVSLLKLPTDAVGAVFYAVGLSALRSD